MRPQSIQLSVNRTKQPVSDNSTLVMEAGSRMSFLGTSRHIGGIREDNVAETDDGFLQLSDT